MFQIYIITFVMATVVVIGALYTYLEIDGFEKNAEKSRTDYINNQKEMVKNETLKVVDYINFTRLFIEDKMKADLFERANQGWEIMNSIWLANNDKLSEAEIKKIIKDALRPIRFNNQRGYYFLASLDGTEELYPVAPHLEGKNLLDLQDEKGNYAVRDEIRLILQSGEGFVTGYWTKPGGINDMIYPKTSYIKLFKPFNWYIGCGEYLDNIERDIQEEVKGKIKQIRFGSEGYIFINTYDGHAVIIDSDVFSEGDYIWELTDPQGIKVIQEEYLATRNPEGGFIKYSWKKLLSNTMAPKISYIKGIDDWQWMVGAGVYVDSIEEEIDKARNLLINRLTNKLLYSLLVISIVIVVVLLAARKVSERIEKNFSIFTNNLSGAVQTGTLLDKSNLNLTDLRNVVEKTNEIILIKAKAESRLRENEIRLRAIFENIPVMIAVFGETMEPLASNKEIKMFFDVRPGESFTKEVFLGALTHSPINDVFKRMFENFDGQFREVELIQNRTTRTHNWAIFKTETNETIMVGYDITEIKKTQQKLKEINDTKDKFFSILSHDLHNPFNTIIGFSELLLEQNNDLTDNERTDMIKQINISSLAMHKLLVNLLNWTRSQTGRIQVYKEIFELKGVVNEIIEVLKPQADNKGIELTNMIPGGHMVFADLSMTSTVLQNLIANAIKFTHTHGKIQILSKIMEEETIISIHDNGIGIGKEMIGQIFDLINEKTRKGTLNEAGTGLGLVICKDFTERMGGRIWVESEAGNGSVFSFSLQSAV